MKILKVVAKPPNRAFVTVQNINFLLTAAYRGTVNHLQAELCPQMA
jgi:hypothetical protein